MEGVFRGFGSSKKGSREKRIGRKAMGEREDGILGIEFDFRAQFQVASCPIYISNFYIKIGGKDVSNGVTKKL